MLHAIQIQKFKNLNQLHNSNSKIQKIQTNDRIQTN